MPLSRKSVLVISLDLELHWGVRDRKPLDRMERARLILAGALIPRLLDLFEEFGIHATWAVVGFLFALSREHLDQFRQTRIPAYRNPQWDPDAEPIGREEREDPFHFAPSIVADLRRRPGQEIASHYFSHLCCSEEGVDMDAFQADLRSAIAIARNSGFEIASYVVPRNQVIHAYLELLRNSNIKYFRRTQQPKVHQSAPFESQQRPYQRVLRLFDNYADLYGPQTQPWPSGPDPLCIHSSRYLRACTRTLRPFEDLQYRRIVNALLSAARTGTIFHLRWDPEDFALNSDENPAFLRRILSAFDQYRMEYGMISLSMKEVGDLAASDDVMQATAAGGISQYRPAWRYREGVCTRAVVFP
jgi:peptidoglycan/xylan/chitin deacetylase (PgdA/CDA1 family)